MDINKLNAAYPGETFPADNGFYNKIERWNDIYNGEPEWRNTKKGGLYKSGKRRMNMLNTAKLLCDEFSRQCFAEQVEISCGNDAYDEYIKAFLDREGFWKNIPELISKGFAHGGCCLREYADNGTVKLSYVEGQSFYPVAWDNNRITEGIFMTVTAKGRDFYTLTERHRFSDGMVRTESKLFKSSDPNALGVQVPLSTIYGEDAKDFAEYPASAPAFQYFRADGANNQQTELPLGIAVFANCSDTLKAIDTTFDSFCREFVLGKKRIIVPSSCIRTVVDPETGENVKYFDTDDEVYQALKCDEEKDLNIKDNTIVLRVDDHIRGINAYLNILCAQVGLTAGSLSFDEAHGMKTATEVISEESKTARTMKANKNLLVEFIEGMCRAVIELAVQIGELPAAEYELAVGFKDNIIIDDNTLIENNIKLVSAGLKSKLTAMMEIMKCDEDTAKAELERIRAEEPVMSGGFDPTIS